jgi:thioesterase domain-containing protein
MEIARELRRAGKKVGVVVIIDTPLPRKNPWNRSSSWRKRLTDALSHRVRLARWRVRLLIEKVRGRESRLTPAWRRFADRAYDDALRRYRPRSFEGRVLSLLAEEPARPAGSDSRLHLARDYLPEGEVRYVPGTHVVCLLRPALTRMAEVLREAFGRTDSS